MMRLKTGLQVAFCSSLLVSGLSLFELTNGYHADEDCVAPDASAQNLVPGVGCDAYNTPTDELLYDLAGVGLYALAITGITGFGLTVMSGECRP